MPDQPPRKYNRVPDSVFAAAIARTEARPRPPTIQQQEEERAKCLDPVYFIDTYCWIYDNATSDWIRFRLWAAQQQTIRDIHENKLEAIIKTRQVGATWMCLCYGLWQGIFAPVATVLIWSRTDEDAVELLGSHRLKGTFERLPNWLKPRVIKDNDHELEFESGSIFHALPTTRGDGFTATFAFIDECDLDPNLATRLERSKPTINAGKAKLVLNSRADKDNPNSTFKNIVRDGLTGKNSYHVTFIPWNAHPGRDDAWYRQECRDSMSAHGSLDEIASNYPTTVQEALAARSLNKRYHPTWIANLFQELQALPLPEDAPAIPQLMIYRYPEPGRRYGIGMDPAGGMADSDDSALRVIDADTKEECAALEAKVEPTVFANYGADISLYFFGAPVLFELNNHGYAVLSQLRERHTPLRAGIQRDGSMGKPGWFTGERNKGKLYDDGGKVMVWALGTPLDDGTYAPESAHPIIHNFKTATQLASIDINTLKAPEGDLDDCAMAWVLGQQCVYKGVPSYTQQPYTGLYHHQRSPFPKPDEKARSMLAKPVQGTKRVEDLELRLRSSDPAVRAEALKELRRQR